MNHTPLARRLLAAGTGAVIGAFAAVTLAGAAVAAVPAPQQSNASVDGLEVSVEGEAGCWPYGEGGAYQWDIWWFVENHSDEHEASLEEVTLTVEPSSAASEVTMDGLYESSTLEPGFYLNGKIELPAETAVTGLTLEATVAWTVDGSVVTDTATGSVSLAASQCADESPVLWEWSSTCDSVTISFTNPFDREVTLAFHSQSGEVVEQTFGAFEWESLTFAYTQGDGVEILVKMDGEQVIEPLRIGARDVDGGCDGDDQAGGEAAEEELPVTGSATALIAGGALALLALGGGLFLVARRRRVSFTA